MFETPSRTNNLDLGFAAFLSSKYQSLGLVALIGHVLDVFNDAHLPARQPPYSRRDRPLPAGRGVEVSNSYGNDPGSPDLGPLALL